MTQVELIEKVAGMLPAEYGGKTQVRTVYEAIRKAISEELKAGGSVSMKELGVFKVVETQARKGRNPRTGEPMMIPAGRKVIFNPAKKLKELMKDEGK